MRRRQFIKTGVAGGLLLTAAALLHRPLDRAGKRALVAANPLSAALPVVVAAIAPVILAGAMPEQGQGRDKARVRIVADVGAAVAALGASAQKEVAELFALLDFPPTRRLVAGVNSAWPDASRDEIAGFLETWRNSHIDLLKSGYMALHDLVLGAWYADPSTWEAIGYPGPPAVPWSGKP